MGLPDLHNRVARLIVLPILQREWWHFESYQTNGLAILMVLSIFVVFTNVVVDEETNGSIFKRLKRVIQTGL